MFPDATQAGTSYTFGCFCDGDQGESSFRLVERDGDGNDGGWQRKLVTGAPGEQKMTTLLAELL